MDKLRLSKVSKFMNNQIEKGLTGRVCKFGCNWAGCEQSFYDFIKKEKIVIGRTPLPYNVGDLILITEGFTVKAIAKVTSQLYEITTKPEYKFVNEEFCIDYDEFTFFANAEWYELPPEGAIFEYRLQRGYANVRNPQIIQKTFQLWNNRNSKQNIKI